MREKLIWVRRDSGCAKVEREEFLNVGIVIFLKKPNL
jgi:hypothetical protein